MRGLVLEADAQPVPQLRQLPAVFTPTRHNHRLVYWIIAVLSVNTVRSPTVYAGASLGVWPSCLVMKAPAFILAGAFMTTA